MNSRYSAPLLISGPVSLPAEAAAFGGPDLCAGLLRSFQQIACRHLGLLGYGDEVAESQGFFWAIVKTDLRIVGVPATGEAPVLDTWPGRNGHGAFWRHYRVRDESGTAVIRAASLWVLMDARSRTLARDPAAEAQIPQWHEEDELPSRFRSIRFPDTAPQISSCRVPPELADRNGHLNNAAYPLLAKTALSGQAMPAGTIRSLSIEYRRELLPGQAVDLQYLAEDSAVYLRGVHDNDEYFTMRWEYDQI